MVENRTLKYLGLCLKTLPDFKTHITHILKSKEEKGIMGFYINDERYIAKDDSELYFFIKATVPAANYLNNNCGDIIVDSYFDIDKNIILVIQPKFQNKDWKARFINGEYSKIYTEKEIQQHEKGEETNFQISRNSVLLKREEYWSTFQQELIKEFGHLKFDYEYDGRELDITPKLEEEILNYKKPHRGE